MELQTKVNSMSAKRLWNVLRVTFFMIRKGLISKRKLITDMNLMIKRGKLLRKSLSNLMSYHHHHHHHSPAGRGAAFRGIQEYEFSCSNSPNPVFYGLPNKRKHHHYYFPCINQPDVMDDEKMVQEEEVGHRVAVVALPKTPDYFNFTPGEKASPLPAWSSVEVRVSNYSSEEEENEAVNGQVDREAEEFIRRFYEQLRVQSRIQLLQYD